MSTVTVKTAVERYDFEDYGTLEESGRYVKFEDYAALAAQRDALAAEVYVVKHPGTYLPSKCETPATDAFLREVRAQGLDMAACALDGVNQFNYANMLDELAEKLRKGGAA